MSPAKLTNPSSDKIYELVTAGMQDVNHIKDTLQTFVEREFSLGATKEELAAILDQNNRAYYPTSHDIRNHMVSGVIMTCTRHHYCTHQMCLPYFV